MVASSVVLDLVLSVVLLNESDDVSVVLSSDSKTSLLILSHSVDRRFGDVEAETHLAARAIVIIPSNPLRSSLTKLEASITVSWNSPSSGDNTVRVLSSILDSVLAMVLLCEVHHTIVQTHVSINGEGTDGIGTGTMDTSAEVNMEVVKPHIVL